AIAAALVVMGTAWMQEENIARGFQLSFYAAFLFPLLAFTALAASSAPEPDVASTLSAATRSRSCFALALALGVASALTLANGLAALPLLALQAALPRQPRWRIAVLVVAAVAVIVLYFQGYTTPPRHGSLAREIANEPLKIPLFVLMLIGSPIVATGA